MCKPILIFKQNHQKLSKVLCETVANVIPTSVVSLDARKTRKKLKPAARQSDIVPFSPVICVRCPVTYFPFDTL